MTETINPWWGTFSIGKGETRRFEIGPLFLRLQRLAQELQIFSQSSDDPDKSDALIAKKDLTKHPHDDPPTKRFLLGESTSSITLLPATADRPQVSRAETPFYLPANQHITIYVSSPAWVRIEMGRHHTLLEEIPTVRLSDTWHGPNTREGELCYASPTFCRMHLKDLPRRNHRIISPIIIYNHTKQPLLLEQFSLPLPFLSVYADPTGGLWTEEIIVKNEGHHRHVVKQGKGAPHIAPDAKLLTHARQSAKHHNFIHLFYSLLTE